MIARDLVISMFFICTLANGQNSLHDEVRMLYCSGWEGMCGAKELAHKLKDENLGHDLVLLAYRGAAISTLANCESMPWNKYDYFKSGKKEIELAVNGDPQNWEIRFIRFTVQSHIPDFLNYNNLDEDKNIVLNALYLNLQQEVTGDFFYTVSEIMLSSELLSEGEKEQLKKLLSKT